MSADHPAGSWSPHPASGPYVGPPPEKGGAAYRISGVRTSGTVETQPAYSSGFLAESTRQAQELNAQVMMKPGAVGPFMVPRRGPAGDPPEAPPVHRTQVLGPLGDDVASATHEIVPNHSARFLP